VPMFWRVAMEPSRMSRTTTDRSDPGINKDRGDGQNEAYIVLSEEERAKGFVRPLQLIYRHDTCGIVKDRI